MFTCAVQFCSPPDPPAPTGCNSTACQHPWRPTWTGGCIGELLHPRNSKASGIIRALFSSQPPTTSAAPHKANRWLADKLATTKKLYMSQRPALDSGKVEKTLPAIWQELTVTIFKSIFRNWITNTITTVTKILKIQVYIYMNVRKSKYLKMRKGQAKEVRKCSWNVFNTSVSCEHTS